MTYMSFSFIMAGVLLNAFAQLLLKAGTNAVGKFSYAREDLIVAAWQFAQSPYILGGLICYAVSVVVWILALSRVPVSVAYPMLSIGYVVNAFIAYYWFAEPLTQQKILGIGFILIGVWLVARSASLPPA